MQLVPCSDKPISKATRRPVKPNNKKSNTENGTPKATAKNLVEEPITKINSRKTEPRKSSDALSDNDNESKREAHSSTLGMGGLGGKGHQVPML